MLAQRAGGWPLTMFLTPDGAPFFGGTYFPKQARYGMPAFAGTVRARRRGLAREARPRSASRTSEVLQALCAHAAAAPRRARTEFSQGRCERCSTTCERISTRRYGGFGAAPKFPHPTDLELCLREGEQDMALVTLERMCEGGIYDQLGGGFCRYSVDARVDRSRTSRRCSTTTGRCSACSPTPGSSRAQPLYARCADETAGWMHARDAVSRRRLLLLARRR